MGSMSGPSEIQRGHQLVLTFDASVRSAMDEVLFRRAVLRVTSKHGTEEFGSNNVYPSATFDGSYSPSNLDQYGRTRVTLRIPAGKEPCYWTFQFVDGPGSTNTIDKAYEVIKITKARDENSPGITGSVDFDLSSRHSIDQNIVRSVAMSTEFDMVPDDLPNMQEIRAFFTKPSILVDSDLVGVGVLSGMCFVVKDTLPFPFYLTNLEVGKSRAFLLGEVVPRALAGTTETGTCGIDRGITLVKDANNWLFHSDFERNIPILDRALTSEERANDFVSVEFRVGEDDPTQPLLTAATRVRVIMFGRICAVPKDVRKWKKPVVADLFGVPEDQVSDIWDQILLPVITTGTAPVEEEAVPAGRAITLPRQP